MSRLRARFSFPSIHFQLSSNLLRLLLLLMACCAHLTAQVHTAGSKSWPRSRPYDVVHYKLVLGFEEEKRKVIGRTSISVTPLSEHLDSIDLDAVSLNVKSVALPSGVSLKFVNRSPVLTVFLYPAFGLNDTLDLVIDYECTPVKGLYFMQPDSSDPTLRHQIWTQGAESDNRYWFPANDQPDDKATSEVIATVRNNYVLLSNGRLNEVSHDAQKGTTTFHWIQSKPHSPYLIMIAAGEYEIIEESYRHIPLQYYVYKELSAQGKRVFERTPDVMKFFEQTLQFPYPWEKYAQVFVDNFMHGAMENTGATTFNTLYMIDERAAGDFPATETVAHELAHQWWGDVVTCRDWEHLWLNEGFATYYEALFTQHDRGAGDFQNGMSGKAGSVFNAERVLGRKPIVSVGSYGANLYQKGAWVLHMLKRLIGDREFHRAMSSFLRAYQFRNADTHEFRRAVEDATGRNLDWFFDQWVYKAGHPKLAVRTKWVEERRAVMIEVEQTQVMDSLTGVFQFPVDVEITTSHGSFIQPLWVNSRTDTFMVEAPEKPAMVIFDRGFNVLAETKHDKTKDELMYQLVHAQDIVYRIVAAKELRKFPDDGDVFEALKRSALRDAFWAVRQEAVVSLSVMNVDEAPDLLFQLYSDRSSRVRNAVVTALERFSGRRVEEFLERAAEQDSSYLVVASCLRSMFKVDSVHAFDFAARYIVMESYRDIVRRSALEVMRKLRDPRTISYAIRYAQPGNPSDIRVRSTTILGETGSSDDAVRELMKRLARDRTASIRKAAVEGIAMWQDEAGRAFLITRDKVEEDSSVRAAIREALRALDGGEQ